MSLSHTHTNHTNTNIDDKLSTSTSTSYNKIDLSVSTCLVGVCIKNNGVYLPRLLKNIETYVSVFKDYKVFFVDGHSTDHTEVILKSWCKQEPTKRFFHRQPSFNLSRGPSLEEARNYVLTLTKPYYDEHTFLLVLDSDSPNAKPIDINGFLTCFERDDWDALFVNQPNEYYDIWALRDDTLLEDYQIKFAGKRWNGEMEACIKPYQTPKVGNDGYFYKVYSAFGGAGIYKSLKLEDGVYKCSTQYKQVHTGKVFTHPICEHVPLHYYMVNKGCKLFINTKWFNGDHT